MSYASLNGQAEKRAIPVLINCECSVYWRDKSHVVRRRVTSVSVKNEIAGQCKTWTLDCGLDRGLDCGLDCGLSWDS